MELIEIIKDEDKIVSEELLLQVNKNQAKKRVYAAKIAKNVIIRQLKEQNFEIDEQNWLSNNSSILTELDINDAIINNAKVDFRVVPYNMEDKAYIPRAHFEYKITPDIYVILKTNTEDINILGFIETKNINPNSGNAKYIILDASELNPISEIEEAINNTPKKSFSCTEEDKTRVKNLYFAYLDDEISQRDKTYVLKHLSQCKDCLIEFNKLVYIDKKLSRLNTFSDIFLHDYEANVDYTELETDELNHLVQVISQIQHSEDDSNIEEHAEINILEDNDFNETSSPQNSISTIDNLGVDEVDIIDETESYEEAEPNNYLDFLEEEQTVANNPVNEEPKVIETDNEIELIEDEEGSSDFLSLFANKETDSEEDSNDLDLNKDQEAYFGEIGANTEEILEESHEVNLEEHAEISLDDIKQQNEQEEDISFDELDTDNSSENFSIENNEENENFSIEDEGEISFNELDTNNSSEDFSLENNEENENFSIDEEEEISFDELETGNSNEELSIENDEENENFSIEDEGEISFNELDTNNSSEDFSLENNEENENFSIDNEEEISFDELDNDNPSEEFSLENNEENEKFSIDEEEIPFDELDNDNSSEDFSLENDRSEGFITQENNEISFDDLDFNNNEKSDFKLNEDNNDFITQDNEEISFNNLDFDAEESSFEINEDKIENTKNTKQTTQNITSTNQEDYEIDFDEIEERNFVSQQPIMAKGKAIKPNKLLAVAAISALIITSAAGYIVLNNKSINNNQSIQLPTQQIPRAVNTQAKLNPEELKEIHPPIEAMPTNEIKEKEAPQKIKKAIELKKPKNINEAMAKAFISNSNAVRISSISWEVGASLASQKDFNTYLILSGQAIKSSLAQELLFTTDMATNDKIIVSLILDKRGSLQNSSIKSSSGSKQIDEIILQTIKDTIRYTKMPDINTNKDVIKTALIINL